MNVYIVLQQGAGERGYYIEGVFSSEAQAEEYAKKIDRDVYSTWVDEFEVQGRIGIEAMRQAVEERD